MAKKADLIFATGGSPSGFNSLAEQSQLYPVTVIRELVQNSLDAAQEAGREQAIIRFELAEHNMVDIPALDTYKKAFQKVKTHWAKKADSMEVVINTIEQQLMQPKADVLFVLDNGCGLNNRSMSALLSEGVSNKQNTGAGAFGYGHTTVIPASNLRYILYGGLHKEKKIAAGHAVLASFEDGKKCRGKDGYFVTEITNKIDIPFKCPTGAAIPRLIKEKLRIVEKEWGGSGSVVAIPGFNYFKDERSSEQLWLQIQKAVACNFFVAVEQGKLRVEFKDGTRSETLDKHSIRDALDKHREEKKKESGVYGGLSGHKAHKAYEAMVHGKNHVVITKCGRVVIKLLGPLDGNTQINLCRNGMHITGDIPSLSQSDFAEYQPFHCLVLVDAITNPEFHRLVRKAEPTKHNKIRLKFIDKPEEIKKLRQVFQEIRAYIKKHSVRQETEEFTIKDVLNLKSFGVNALEELAPRVRARGSSGLGRGGGGGKGEGGHGKGGDDGGFRKQGRPVSFFATPVQTGKRSYAVQIDVEKSTHDNEIRFALDESLDLTCDNANAEDFVHLQNIKIDGKKIAKGKLVKDKDGKVLGINLGHDKTTVEMTFDFAIPDSVNIGKNTPVSLQAELVSRKKEAVEKRR